MNLSMPYAIFVQAFDYFLRCFFGALVAGSVQYTHVLSNQLALIVTEHLLEAWIGIDNHAIAGAGELNTFRHIRRDLALKTYCSPRSLLLGDVTINTAEAGETAPPIQNGLGAALNDPDGTIPMEKTYEVSFTDFFPVDSFLQPFPDRFPVIRVYDLVRRPTNDFVCFLSQQGLYCYI